MAIKSADLKEAEKWYEKARELGMEQEGLALVRIEVLPPSHRLASAAGVD